MAWGPESGRTVPLPPNWDELRLEQLKIDKWRCTWVLPKSKKRCPRRATDVDHYGRPDDHTKLRSLCSHHHGKRTSKQGHEARAAKSRVRPIRVEEDPGLLG